MNAEPKKIAAPALGTQVQEVMALITAFSALLTKETDALKKADFAAVDALQGDKKLFATQYNAKIAALAERRDEWQTLEVALREKLIKHRAAFAAVLNDNMLALERAQNSVKRLVNNILEAARQAVAEDNQTAYSRAGRAMTYRSAGAALTTDHRL